MDDSRTPPLGKQTISLFNSINRKHKDYKQQQRGIILLRRDGRRREDKERWGKLMLTKWYDVIPDWCWWWGVTVLIYLIMNECNTNIYIKYG